MSGYLYLLGTDAQPDLAGALPSVCPCCGENYARRLYRKSPIRGFRTGFSKLTQLLSKELFYLVPGQPPGSRKLVLFSDSREEAASLANGVERSHYLDLVREALYDELAKLAIGEPQLLADLEAHSESCSLPAARFAATHPAAQQRLARLIRSSTSPIPDLDDPDMVGLLRQRQAAAEAALAEVRQRAETRTVPLRLLFEGPDGDPAAPGTLVLRMKALGVNPGGPEVLYQDYRYDGSWHRWTDFFDFSAPDAGWRGGLSPDGRERKERLRSKVVSETCGILFSRLYFGFESAGLGYPCLDLTEDHLARLAAACGAKPDLFASICDATLRVMGALYRYPQEPQEYPLTGWPDWAAARARLRNFVKQCAAANGLGETATLRAVWQAICQDGGHPNLIINPRRLDVRLAVPGDPVWICESCTVTSRVVHTRARLDIASLPATPGPVDKPVSNCLWVCLPICLRAFTCRHARGRDRDNWERRLLIVALPRVGR